MNKYIKLFETHSNYENYINSEDKVLPNVSYCIEENEVHYNPYVHDYSKDYLTTKALENGTISFNIWSSMGTDYITSISYSTDNGETWTTTNNTDNKESNLQITVNVSSGDKILWKGSATQLGYYYSDYGDCVGSFFSSTGTFNVQGNVMSMLYGDDFMTHATALDKNGQLARLFSNYNEGLTCGVVNAENLILPSTTLADSCYQYMFDGCNSLTTAPVLPATTLANACYSGMFYGCTSLTTAPELPATTLAGYCYDYMFNSCTSLTTAPVLPATTLADYCYEYMFYGCTSLNNITCLATDISAYGCTSNWVNNIVTSGTFTKAASMTSWTTGVSGIPSNWTVQNAGGSDYVA